MPFLLNDPTFMLLIPALIFAFWAQFYVKSNYEKFSKKENSRGITGAEAAKRILSENGVDSIEIEQIRGELTDHYDPRTRKLRLSGAVYSGKSIAAIGVAAHESGHAIQHATGYAAIHARNAIYPVAAFGSNLAFPLFAVGLFFLNSKFLMDLGIMLYIVALCFTVITLPVEFNASGRAIKILSDGKYLVGDELNGARKVLRAAAMTYIAATAMAAIQLLRMLVLRDRRN